MYNKQIKNDMEIFTKLKDIENSGIELGIINVTEFLERQLVKAENRPVYDADYIYCNASGMDWVFEAKYSYMLHSGGLDVQHESHLLEGGDSLQLDYNDNKFENFLKNHFELFTKTDIINQ